jgi:hypothetical protein
MLDINILASLQSVHRIIFLCDYGNDPTLPFESALIGITYLYLRITLNRQTVTTPAIPSKYN